MDVLGRTHVALDEKAIDALYEHNRDFWLTRYGRDREELIEGQVVMDTPYNSGERKRLKEIYAGAENFSMLELGAANGTVFERLGTDDFFYTGFEMMPELANDLLKKHQERKLVHVGGAEEFIECPQQRLFSLFYAHVSLVMIKPSLVREVLKKAAQHCEEFLIYDFLCFDDVVLSEGEAYLIDTGHQDKWFIHDWDTYLEDAGMRIESKEMGGFTINPEYDNQVYGCGFIHAVKK